MRWWNAPRGTICGYRPLPTRCRFPDGTPPSWPRLAPSRGHFFRTATKATASVSRRSLLRVGAARPARAGRVRHRSPDPARVRERDISQGREAYATLRDFRGSGLKRRGALLFFVGRTSTVVVASTHWPANRPRRFSGDRRGKKPFQRGRKSNIQMSIPQGRAFREKYAPTSTCAYSSGTWAEQLSKQHHS